MMTIWIVSLQASLPSFAVSETNASKVGWTRGKPARALAGGKSHISLRCLHWPTVLQGWIRTVVLKATGLTYPPL